MIALTLVLFLLPAIQADPFHVVPDVPTDFAGATWLPWQVIEIDCL